MSSASSFASPRRSTSSAYSSDDDDAITPAPVSCVAPPLAAQQPQVLPRTELTPSPASSRRSSFSGLTPPAESVGVDSDRLWKRMLSVQRVFGCYNSARMSAALSAGDKDVVCRLRPSQATLELLNDSVSQLPEETKEQVEKYLYAPPKTRKSGWKKH